MIITVDNNRYFTNLSDESLIEKCKEFYSSGCLSYAVSFYNLPNWAISRTKEKGFDCLILKDWNSEYRFVPEHAKDITEADKVIQKGLNIIELC